MVDTMTQPVVVIDQNFCVTTANNAFIEAFGVDRDDILSENIFSLGNRQWDIPELRQLVSAVVPRAAAIIGFEVSHDFPNIGPRTFLRGRAAAYPFRRQQPQYPSYVRGRDGTPTSRR
ncbi:MULTISPECIES: PAS domain-containing protein [unclassified Rhizobium]|uniref:PAS domain-containing protein n=1 Tax=unclassified Rhizobium TaxID=2613769 RepID=UPI0017C5A1B4|nr:MULTISPECIES: PAS domain-containing protein [unclassified Rhizobium]MBB3319531.1 PAS domain-containing protein [Rhizobium sp. BK181]MCS4095217.1 PAS domain-containing protein [Rhizobium sp. BK176]